MGELVDTEEPLDIDAFIENVDNAFRECAVDEGAETEEVIVPKTEASDRYAWYLVKSEVTRKQIKFLILGQF